jgi:hypothetical protein
VSQLNVTYAHDPKFGHLPTGWKHQAFHGDGKLQVEVSASQVSHELNSPVKDEEFDLTFPPGTRVFDERTGQRFIVRE